ncbi:(d)CMP kinase [Zavarzinella formosa]|uniref:(d)CMP kinase n=1 Tax=Zavarzinella formosa TaxID=360055 RepID=UPI0003184EAE|nr:(d)CMP kinase [Zavarzinella formosa]
MIVTIDGPAGSGKSTAAKGLAKRLSYEYLDTGAMYRAIAHALIRADIPFGDEMRVVPFLSECKLEMPPGRVILNGDDITEIIRSPAMSDASSRVAAQGHVRAILVGWQRQIAAGRQMVCEGRDQGSVVFVESPCKFYLTASVEVRAKRRLAELLAKHIPATLDSVMQDIEIRDHRDKTRAVGPLVQPDDAMVIVTDNLTPENVLDRLEEEVKKCVCG